VRGSPLVGLDEHEQLAGNLGEIASVDFIDD
jgi:hypothetical protein